MKVFCSIPLAIEEFQKGKMFIVVNDFKKENQAKLIFAAEKVTPEKVNFLLKNCRGLICVAITKKQALKLQLPLMVDPLENKEKGGTQFTVSVDSEKVKSFGISAKDRAETIKVLANSKSKPSDLVKPGHIFPLLAHANTHMKREREEFWRKIGYPEVGVSLARLSGLFPASVLCEILNEKGEVLHLPQLIKFAQKFEIKILTIKDLISYLKEHPLPPLEKEIIFKTASSSLLTKYGLFNISVYKSIIDNREHVALFKGKFNKAPVLVRIHCECLTSEVFSSLKCDCQKQLEKALKLIGKKGGIFIYLNQEGRGVGLTNKIRAYSLQDKGFDTVEAQIKLSLPVDPRDYEIAAEILKDLGISKINLLTNNPHKIEQLRNFGIEVLKRIPLEISPNEFNKNYLRVKKYKLGHILKLVE